MKRVIPILLIATGAMIGGCANNQTKPGGSGLLEATEMIVSAQNSGQVTALYFDEGTDVKAGDTLLVIDPTRVQLQLDGAKAGRQVAVARLSAARFQLKRAKETEQYAAKELNRVQRLVKASTATQKQLDDITHQHTTAAIAVKSAEAAVATGQAEIKKIDADIAQLKQALDDSYPTAPGAGVVTEKYTDFGNLLAPGRPIAKISQIDSVWVKVYLPMAEFAQVKIGEKATVNTEAGETYPGVVTWTSDQAEFTPKNVQTKKARADLVYAVKVKMANADRKLKVGQPVYVTIGA